MLRAVLALVALAALALAGLQPPAMAMAAAAQPPQAMAGPDDGMDCHAAAGKSAQPDKPAKAPGCCPEGQCDGKCAPVAALFPGAARGALSLLRAAPEAPALAAVPSAAADGIDHPPRPRA